MVDELMPCPFCGGEVSVVVLDDEGNVRDEEHELDPYSGLSYAVAHDDPNGACPIATYDAPLPWLYDSRDGVAHVWNRRAERTCRMVRTGEPSPTGVPRERRCSECGGRLTRFGNYCPDCGARIEEEVYE